ncbi:hypothetical protein DFP72DRAFT_885750 [Ephemerocybe angulata]|uniref:BTB domain-containing protein n=1 Tax=Ephemerocybe angulata TaxID=980116 RepID=A0A8H6MBJ8_9AGAR|nr:hypothetical protein DFP72DRAFT_885750 [Tulosesus angulatus]
MPKRRRVADPEIEEEREDLQMDAPSTITRSDIWFRDGNMILQTEGTQFKVHQGFLEKHSSVFADMFSFPQPEGDEDSTAVEGCHVVQIYDAPEDIELLLLALYDQHHHTQGRIPFKTISAMIRMGKKYGIQHLRDEGAQLLANEFPKTLEEFGKTSLETWTYIVPEVGLLPKVVALAHQCDIPTILPAVYFRSLRNMDTLLYGDLLSDGTGRSETLPDRVLRACLAGNEQIIAGLGSTFSWLDEAYMCMLQCFDIGRDVKVALWTGRPKAYRALCTWKQLASEFGELNKLCSECLISSKKQLDSERKETWEKLPSYFGLPEWKDMKDFSL